MKFVGKINGFVFERQKQLIDSFRKFEGKKVEIEVKEYVKKPTDPQRAYYFAAMVTPIVLALREHGAVLDKDQVHDYLMRDIGKNTKIDVLPNGEIIEVRMSWKELDAAKKVSEYFEVIRAWAAETLNLILEDPYYTGVLK